MNRCLFLCAVVWCAVASRSFAGGLELNGNGMSDTWGIVYGASALSPGVDSDGDGFSNLQESLAEQVSHYGNRARLF
jgi:hypothetical protein